jgi:hypothetical protein
MNPGFSDGGKNGDGAMGAEKREPPGGRLIRGYYEKIRDGLAGLFFLRFCLPSLFKQITQASLFGQFPSFGRERLGGEGLL